MAKIRELLLEGLLLTGLIFSPVTAQQKQNKKTEYIVYYGNISPDKSLVDGLTNKLKKDGWNAYTVGLHPDNNPNMTNYHTEITTFTSLSQEKLADIAKKYDRRILKPFKMDYIKVEKEIEQLITDMFNSVQKKDVGSYISCFNTEVLDLNNGSKVKLDRNLVAGIFKEKKVSQTLDNVSSCDSNGLREFLAYSKLNKFYSPAENDCGVELVFKENSSARMNMYILRKISGKWKIVAAGEIKQ